MERALANYRGVTMTNSGASPNPYVRPEPAETSPVDDSTAQPFAHAETGPAADGVTLHNFLQQTVAEVGASANASHQATARAADLTVKDLNDLAAEFSGVQSYNPRVSELTIEDVMSIEAVFYDVKMNAIEAAREVASGAAQAQIFDNWSCCSCTPCCCCAASDPSPFDSCPASDPSPFDS
jgi:hypothetical protein